MVYAHQQLGQHGAAREVAGEAQRNPARIDHPASAYAYAAMPARLALERGAWKDAAAVELFPAAGDFPWKKYTFAEAVDAYARGLRAAMSGDAAGARTQVARLRALGEATKVPYWAEQIAIQAEVVEGLAVRAEGRTEEALAVNTRLLARLDATWGADDPRIAPVLERQAVLLDEAGRSKEAKAVRKRIKALGG